jgi:hypothetical protein
MSRVLWRTRLRVYAMKKLGKALPELRSVGLLTKLNNGKGGLTHGRNCSVYLSPEIFQDGILEARVGFEPTNGGFADLSLRPLGYRAPV